MSNDHDDPSNGDHDYGPNDVYDDANDAYGDPNDVYDDAAGAGWWATRSPRSRTAITAGAIAAVLLILVGIVIATGGDDDEAPPPTTAPATTTTIGITTTTEPETGPIAPLTGLRLADLEAATRPAIAVKIDNLDTAGETALPQAGLPRADVVFEELVEGGITRLVAVFHSQDPGSRVGPVRSARTTDLHILPQFGRTLLAWSGGNDGVVAAVRGEPSIIDLGHGALSSAYVRDQSRRAPHNLYVDAGSLWVHAPEDTKAPDPIFVFRDDEAPLPSSATPSGGVDIAWAGPASAAVSWDWDPELELYKRSQRGLPHADEGGTQIGAQNVVVLITPYGQSPADTRSPEALTVGSGEALVFSAGSVIRGRWDRPEAGQPAQLLDEDGAPIPLTPGQTWIELPEAGRVTAR